MAKRPTTGVRTVREQRRGGIRAGLAVALEITAHAHALGVVAAIAGMRAGVVLQLVHQPLRGQPVRRQPAADVAEGGER